MVTLVSAVAQILSGFCKWPGQTELSYVCLYCFTVLMLMLLHLIGATTLNRGHSYIDITTVSSDRSVHSLFNAQPWPYTYLLSVSNYDTSDISYGPPYCTTYINIISAYTYMYSEIGE